MSSKKEKEEKGFFQISDYFTTENITFIFFGITFIYFIINNIYFVNASYFKINPSKIINIFGILFFILFYIFFFLLIFSATRDMIKEYTSGKTNQEKRARLLMGIVLTIVILVFILFIMPQYLSISGLFPKGLLRTWNPFKFDLNSNNQEISFAEKMNGYDNQGLFWGGNAGISDLENWKFFMFSLPLIIANFFTSFFSFINPFIIPAMAGDGSNSGMEWSQNNNNSDNIKLDGGLGWVIWILLLPVYIILKPINYILYLITGDNILFKYLNPVDWDLLKKMSVGDNNIKNYYNISYFNTNTGFIKTRYFGVWLNAFFIILLAQLAFNPLLFPTGSQFISMTIRLVIAIIIIGYFIYQVVNKQSENSGNKNLINVFGYKSLSIFNNNDLSMIRNSLSQSTKITSPGIFFPIEKSFSTNNTNNINNTNNTNNIINTNNINNTNNTTNTNPQSEKNESNVSEQTETSNTNLNNINL